MSPLMRRRFFFGPLGERGVAALEFAFVLPVLMLIAFGIIDLGRAVWTQTTLDYAAQAAARCRAIGSASCSTDALAQTYGVTQAYGLTGVTMAVSQPVSGNCAGYKQARATKNFSYIFPFFTHYSGTFTSTACYPI